jgi:hypothetical protein
MRKDATQSPTSIFDSFYFKAYKIARDLLANGQKDQGLRSLFALRNDLGQGATHDGEFVQLRGRVESTLALWGAGFDWD